MKIKKNDKIKIICGKDKGKSGKVLRVAPKSKKISIDGLNLRVKHMRPKKQGEKGERIQFPAPMDISNVILICPKCSKETRVEYKVSKSEDSKNNKFRVCKKCKEMI